MNAQDGLKRNIGTQSALEKRTGEVALRQWGSYPEDYSTSEIYFWI